MTDKQNSAPSEMAGSAEWVDGAQNSDGVPDHASLIATKVADRCHGNRKVGQAPERYEMIWQAARLGALEAAARITELEAHIAELQSKVSDDDCACSFDEPGDVCAVHSPMLKKAQADVAAMQAHVAAEPDRMREVVERCARVAEDYDGTGMRYDMHCELGDAPRTASDIAAAIRAIAAQGD